MTEMFLDLMYYLIYVSNKLKKNNKMGGVVKHLIVFCNKFIKFNSQTKSML